MTAKLGFVDDFGLRIFLLRNKNFTSGNFPCIDDYSIYPNKYFFSCMESTLQNPVTILLNVCYDFLLVINNVSRKCKFVNTGYFLLSSCLYVIHVQHFSIYLTVLFNYRLV